MIDANLRPIVHAAHRSLVATADTGRLEVHSEGRMRPAVDEADVDAWLADVPLPSVEAWREEGPGELAAAGVEIG